jgi:hypothetical protein
MLKDVGEMNLAFWSSRQGTMTDLDSSQFIDIEVMHMSRPMRDRPMLRYYKPSTEKIGQSQKARLRERAARPIGLDPMPAAAFNGPPKPV